MNRTFGRLATGQEKTAELSNHASFGTNGNFTFNGFTPVNQKKEAERRISYLSFRISGGLIGENMTTLFDNKQFNTNVNFDLSFHFQFPKKKEEEKQETTPTKKKKQHTSLFLNNIQFYSDARIRYFEEVRLIDLESSRKQADIDARFNNAAIRQQILLNENALRAAETYQTAQSALLNDIMIRIEAERQVLAVATGPALKASSDQLEKLTKERKSLMTKLDSIIQVASFSRAMKDSLDEVFVHIEQIADNKKSAVESAASERKLQLQLDPKLKSIQQNWFSLTVGFGNKAYYTYYDSLAFDQQIASHTLESVKLGLQWNYYFQNFDEKRITYFNLGISNQLDNNLKDFDAIEVSDETSTSSGNTKRKTSNKYAAYTDKIEDFQSTSLFANYYLLFGSKFYSGVHVYPDWEFRSNSKQLVNVGIGLIASFKNEAKNKGILNLEGFIRFKDVVNILHTPDQFYQRAQIGFRVGIPIQPL